MKKFRIIAIALLLVVLTLSLTACFDQIIPDTNGDDDFSLETIDDKQIKENNKYFGLAFATQSSDGGYKATVIGKLSGVWQVAQLQVQGYGSRVLIKTNMTVDSGNCRLVLVRGNQSIVNDFDIHGEDSYFLYLTGTETYYLKVAGESAKISQLEFSWQLV